MSAIVMDPPLVSVTVFIKANQFQMYLLSRINFHHGFMAPTKIQRSRTVQNRLNSEKFQQTFGYLREITTSEPSTYDKYE